MSTTIRNKDSPLAKSKDFKQPDLKGKSVIVTGGGSGLGEQFTRDFVKAGAFVTIGDISEPAGRKLVEQLGSTNVQFIKCDVRNWSDQLALFKAAIKSSPNKSLDIVCANAGIATKDDLYAAEDSVNGAEPQKPDLAIVEITLIGLLYTTKLALHYLASQPELQDKCLILTASLAAYVGQPLTPQYCAAKFGTRGLLRCLRETAPHNMHGVRVNLIAPWYIKTAIIGHDTEQLIKDKGVEYAKVEDAARAVMHIASDKTLDGHTFAVVPRSENADGYFDFDDSERAEELRHYQKGCNHLMGDL